MYNCIPNYHTDIIKSPQRYYLGTQTPDSYLNRGSQKELEQVFERKSGQQAAVVPMLMLVVGHLKHVVHHDDHARKAED